MANYADANFVRVCGESSAVKTHFELGKHDQLCLDDGVGRRYGCSRYPEERTVGSVPLKLQSSNVAWLHADGGRVDATARPSIRREDGVRLCGDGERPLGNDESDASVAACRLRLSNKTWHLGTPPNNLLAYRHINSLLHPVLEVIGACDA